MIEKGKVILMGTATDGGSGGGSSGGDVASVNGKTGAVVLTGADINVSSSDTTTIASALTTIDGNIDTMGGTVETLDNDVEELGTQVAEIQTTVNAIPSTYATKAEIPAAYTLPAATTSALGGVKPDGTTITVTADGTISAAAQPATLSATGHSYQIFSGVPTADPVTVGTDLARTLMPQTVKIPAENADFSLSSDGCGLVCATAGVVHIKKIVTVGTATTSNIYQALYKNQAAIDNGQIFIHSSGSLSFEADFYSEVAANDELCIMANTTGEEFMINYSGVTVFAEYL